METKYEMMWRILREDGYQREFAEQIADNFNQNLALLDEGAIREGIEKTISLLLENDKFEEEE